jgi:NAD(P)-dependent dehydrogenase (short-subunit alcohol dehydrogenase family)
MSIDSSTIAIVTGGSRGIGFATASALLARGALVGITGTDERRLEDARVALSGTAGARVMALRADVRVQADVDQAVGRAVTAWGGLDVLVNNAGVGGFVEVSEMTSADWHRVVDTNLTGVYHCCHAAIPHLKARGGGWIINVSSLAGKNPFVGGAAYCASKAGLNAFSEALMQEVRHDGIRVSVVMPGSVRTGFSSAGDGAGTDWKLAPDDVAQVIVDLVGHPARSLPSRVEIRPSRPPRK